MAAADVLVHNAGGLSLTEGLAAGLPVITYQPLPGHGRANAALLAKVGLAPWPQTPEELRDGCDRHRQAQTPGAPPSPVPPMPPTWSSPCSPARGRQQELAPYRTQPAVRAPRPRTAQPYDEDGAGAERLGGHHHRAVQPARRMWVVVVIMIEVGISVAFGILLDTLVVRHPGAGAQPGHRPLDVVAGATGQVTTPTLAERPEASGPSPTGGQVNNRDTSTMPVTVFRECLARSREGVHNAAVTSHSYGSSSKDPTWRGRTIVKCRRSSVSTVVTLCRSASAITLASAAPRGRLAYRGKQRLPPYSESVWRQVSDSGLGCTPDRHLEKDPPAGPPHRHLGGRTTR